MNKDENKRRRQRQYKGCVFSSIYLMCNVYGCWIERDSEIGYQENVLHMMRGSEFEKAFTNYNCTYDNAILSAN